MEIYTINGVTFEYDAFDLHTVEIRQNWSVAVKEASKKFSESDDEQTVQAMYEYVDSIFDYFDGVLGDGAAEKIFGKRRNLKEITNAYVSFQNQITRNMQDGVEQPYDPPKMNREQRREAERSERRHSRAKMMPLNSEA